MPNTKDDNNTDGFAQAVETIRTAWKTSRPIVPIIGAGLSAESGVPPISPIIRYLGQVAAMVAEGFLVPPNPKEEPNTQYLRNYTNEVYRQNISLFVQEQGWPKPTTVEYELNRRLRNQGKFHSTSDLAWDSLGKQIRKILPQSSARLEALLNNCSTSQTPMSVNSLLAEVLVDWRVLVQHFTGYKRELSDSLFKMVHEDKKPSPYFHVLATLVRLLNVRSVFTFNFDNLVETAMWLEGLNPTVFAMEFGRGLPPKALISSLCVIKMHGSTHNLLVDTSLDQPLSKDYTDLFLQITGNDPLFLVFGSSGNDRRLRDLLKSVQGRHGQGVGGSPKIIWFSHSKDKRVCEVHSDFMQAIRLHEVRSPIPAFLLFELFENLTGRLPRIKTTYKTNYSKPLSRRLSNAQLLRVSRLVQLSDDRIEVVSTSNLPKRIIVDGSGALSRQFSDQVLPSCYGLILLCECLPLSHHIIYLDLEQHYSVGSVLEEIVGKARVIDRELIPSLMPVVPADAYYRNPGALKVEDAADLITFILERNQIVLIFDGLDTVDWSMTTHHGITTNDHPDPSGTRASAASLMELVERLFFQKDSANVGSVSESIVIATYDCPSSRHTGNKLENDRAAVSRAEFLETFDKLSPYEVSFVAGVTDHKQRLDHRKEHFLGLAMAADSSKEAFNATARFLQLLCTARRTRPLPFVKFLYERSHASGDIGTVKFTTEIDQIESAGFVNRLEGGFFAIDRATRNYVYDNITAGVSNLDIVRHCVEALSQGKGGEAYWNLTSFVEACKTCCNAAMLHSRCAHWYFHYSFSVARDAHAFLEFVYHRVSCIRYLTDLCILLHLVQVRTQSENSTDDEMAHCLAGLWCHIADQIDEAKEFEPTVIGKVEGLDESPLGRIFETATVRKSRNVRDVSLSGLLKMLFQQRARYISSLVERWRAADTVLRSALIPQTLLGWTETLIHYDIKRNLFFEGRIAKLKNVAKDELNEKVAAEILDKLLRSIGSANRKEDEALRSEFARAVNRTEFRSRYENGDFLTLALVRYQFLAAELHKMKCEPCAPEPEVPFSKKLECFVKWFKKLFIVESSRTNSVEATGNSRKNAMYDGNNQEVSSQPTFVWEVNKDTIDGLNMAKESLSMEDSAVGQCLHAMLDIEIALHWLYFCRGEQGLIGSSPWGEVISQLKMVIEVLIARATRTVNGPFPSWLKEAVLRESYCAVESKLGKYSTPFLALEFVLADTFLDTFTTKNRAGEAGRKPTVDSANELRDCLKNIVEGKNELAHEVTGLGRYVNNPFLNATDDSRVFVSYRAFFAILHARLFASVGFSVLLDRTGQLTLAKQKASIESAFGLAYTEFDKARGSIDGNNKALWTMCDYFAAEASYIHARLLRKLEVTEGEPSGRVLSQSEEAKLRSCSTYLKAAKDGLFEGGRHVIIWRAVTVLSARCSAQLVWVDIENFARSCSAEEQRANYGKCVREIKDALQGIRHAVDLCPSGSETFVKRAYDALELIMAAAIATHWCSLELLMRSQSIATRNNPLASFIVFWIDVCGAVRIDIDNVQGWRAIARDMLKFFEKSRSDGDMTNIIAAVSSFRTAFEKYTFGSQEPIYQRAGSSDLWRKKSGAQL